MKKILSRRFKITAVFFLACLMITGIGTTYALFTDRDSKTGVTANMATVDIELESSSFTQANSNASFAIANNSNIDIYLRAGIIFELTTENGEPMIADTNGISISTSSTDWKAEKKTMTDNSKTYTKWYLQYGNGVDYTEVKPGVNPTAAFNVTGIPGGSKLIVNVVPEAVQVDLGKDALNYFKTSGNVNPAW